MLAPVVTKRYAEALFAAAQDARLASEVEGDLAIVAKALSEPALAAMLRNPTVSSKAQKEQILGVIDASLRTNLVRNVVSLVLDRRRSEVLFALSPAFHRLVIDWRGEAEGIVESAKPLTEGEHRAIEEKLSSATGRKVKLKAALNPALLGGIRATVSSLRYDSSVQTRLAELRERMLNAPL